MPSHVVLERRYTPFGAIHRFACGISSSQDEDSPIAGDGPMCDSCLPAAQELGLIFEE